MSARPTPAHGRTRSRTPWALVPLIAVLASALAAAIVLRAPSGVTSTGAATSPGPDNLLSATQSCGTTEHWAGYGVTLSTVSNPVQGMCSGALAITASATGGPVAGQGNVAAATGNGPKSWTRGTPQTRYAAAAYVQAESTGRPVAGVEAFYGAAGNVLTAVWGNGAVDLPGEWTQLPAVVAIAPAGTAFVSFMVVIYGTHPGEVHYLDGASLTATSVSPSGVDGPLHTVGNQIVQANGHPVILRGIMREGTEVSATDFPLTAEIAQAKAWGANVVRVPLNESFWVNTCTAGDPSNVPSYPEGVSAEVSAITSLGMVAVLDLHDNVTATCGTASQQAMADEQYAPTFWAQVAARFKSNPLVAFDLYNEPHNISDAVWLEGGAASYDGTTFAAAGMQQLYRVVRSTGANNLVFVSGTDWASAPAAALVSGTNIVNAVHVYTCQSPPCSSSDLFNPWPILSQWTVVARNEPVMITEAGYPSATTGANFTSALIGDAESLDWGWIAFAWDGTTTGEFDLLASAGSTYEPSPAGMPVLAGLERN